STKKNIQLNKTSSLYKLDPFVDDKGILRVGGRLKRANLSENHKFPIILPKNNHVSNLIVRDFHERVKHQGRGITLNEIRSNGYWIIKGTAAVSKCIADTTGAQLDDESLRTLFCEVEAIVNSHPLTVDSMNDPDSLSPLTPNHLLTMMSKIVLPPPGVFQSVDLYSRKRWRRVQNLANEFWSRWRKEFLHSLQQ
ncbi:Hypothetical predicted protein, partial [Paramuricea clavata]